MRSKVHPKYKTKYRVGNWSAYEQALVQRGDVTLWLSADATDAWRPSPSGRPGAPKTFSDCAIETALTLRLVFRLPLRQAEGFLRSVLSLMGVDLAAPDPTTLSRRSQSLAVECRRIPSRGPIHLIVDSTGRSIVGEGEWAAVKHGGRGHRGWKKLHLAVDRVGVIVAHALTRVENAFFRYKSIIGDRLRARSRGGRVAESVVACNVLNQMTELGRPESYSIGR